MLICAHIFVTLLCVLLLWINSVKASNMFKSRYPNRVVIKRHWSDSVLIFIKFGLMAICPVINLGLAWIFVADSDDLCENAVWDVYKRSKEREDVT